MRPTSLKISRAVPGLLACAALVGSGTFFGCGVDERPDAPTGTGGSSSSTGGGSTGGGDGSGGSDGTGASMNVGGEGGDPGPYDPECGDFFLDPSEECEEGLFRDVTCVSLGFTDGTLACSDSCRITTEDCAGVEDCGDTMDNDGDGEVDCLDSDCAPQCADACVAPPSHIGSMFVNNTTAGRSTLFDSSCSDAGGSGPEMIYEVTAGEDGKLDVTLLSDEDLTISVTTTCGAPNTELICHSPRRVSVDASAAQVFYVTIDGNTAADFGDYSLEVRSRIPGCGDGVRDDDEECDDANIKDGDGCDEDCFLIPNEVEPNGSDDNANTYSGDEIVAQLGASDTDFFAITLTAASSTIVADTLHMGDGACSLNLMDTVIKIFDTNGSTLLKSDDNSGDGLCASAFLSGLPAGTYFVSVSAANGANPSTFPYIFKASVGVCGSGGQTRGEECDDGNLVAGDGCDENCEAEF